jgi:hypothetical protein
VAFNKALLLSVTILAVHPLPAQEAVRGSQAKAPTLQLEVIPLQNIYASGETVVVKYKLTNLSDTTVCFPPPSAKSEDEAEGYLNTSATSRGEEVLRFLEGFWPRSKPDQELLIDADERCIKLAPSLSYVTQDSPLPGSFSAGEWNLHSSYSPPYLRGRAKMIADSLGCSPPEVGAHSAPVKIRVIVRQDSQ